MARETIDITVTLKNGKRISSEVEVVYYTESNYGADADGNRGISALFVEDIIIPEFKEDDDGNPLTEEEIEIAKNMFEEKAPDLIDC